MKINIIGAGVVGLATGRGFARFGYDVVYGDIAAQENTRLEPLEAYYRVGVDSFPYSDIHFVCTPEEVAPDVVKQLAGVIGAIVIRSSVLPGTTQGLTEELNRPIWHNPEFLREITAEDDFLHTKFTLVGYSEWDYPFHRFGLVEAYEAMGVKVVSCTSTESELAKLLTNCYLATQISFWNEVGLLADELGVNSHRVARLMALDKRVSKYGAYKHGAAYGGRCLPKDVSQVLKFASKLRPQVIMPTLEAAQNVNQCLGGQ